jgi:hypothetical protein
VLLESCRQRLHGGRFDERRQELWLIQNLAGTKLIVEVIDARRQHFADASRWLTAANATFDPAPVIASSEALASNRQE